MWVRTEGFEEPMIRDFNISTEEIKKTGKKIYNTDCLSEKEKYCIVRRIANNKIKNRIRKITLTKIVFASIFTFIVCALFSLYEIIPVFISFAFAYFAGIIFLEPDWYSFRKRFFRKLVGVDERDYVDVYYWYPDIGADP